MSLRNALIVFVFFLLLACSQSPYRAQVEYKGYNPVTDTAEHPLSVAQADTGEPYVPTDTLILPPITEDIGSQETHYVQYVVKQGDTAYSIARAYEMSLTDLRQKNNLDTHYTIYPDDILVVKAVDGAKVVTPVIRQATTTTTTKQSATAWVSPVSPANVVAEYLQATNKKDRSGMLLFSTPGGEVVAAADGTVVFAGDDSRQLGNLVLIDHGDKVISAYAHLGEITATEDTKVHAGQTIGHLARSVKQPMLLQIRANGTTTNPRRYISFR